MTPAKLEQFKEAIFYFENPTSCNFVTKLKIALRKIPEKYTQLEVFSEISKCIIYFRQND